MTFFGILFLLAFTILTGCANIETMAELDPKIYYKPDVQLKLGKKKFNGWGVLPRQNNYKFEIKTPGKIDLLKISTCARFDTDEPGGRVFKSSKTYTYQYDPDPQLEMEEACPLRIEAYEFGLPGRHAFGVYELEAGPESLEKAPALVTCNGRKQAYGGVSMCVSLQGLKQRIEFEKPMELNMGWIKDECKIKVPKDPKVWIYDIKKRECVYLFREIGGEKKYHRHFAVGAEDIPVRRHR